MSALFLAVLLPAQDPALAERLKRDGWKAVEEFAGQPKVKPDLEKLAKSEDAELKWWAEATLAELDARGRPGFIGVRRISLEAKERKAHEVLAELLAFEKLRLVGDLAAAQGPVTVSFKETSFFEAVDEVCRQARCVLARKPDGTFEIRVDDEPLGRPIGFAGPLSFTVTSVTHRSAADFRKDPAHTLQIGLSVRPDPRAWVRAGKCSWEFVSAVDDTGTPLEVSMGGGWGWSGNQQPPAMSITAALPRPGRAVRKIARLRGIATLQACRDPREVVFNDVLGPKEQTLEAGPIKLTLRPVTFQDREYLASLDYLPKEALGGPDMDDLALEDSDGQTFSHGAAGKDDDGHVFRFFSPFGEMKKPARLRVTVLPDLHVRKVYFELRDIPIR